MKGLLYKDYINGKIHIGIIIFYLFYLAIMITAIASDFNSAAGLEEKIAQLSENLPILLACIFIACLIPTSMSTILCTLDNKTKWTLYATALPGGYKIVVLEKYVVVLIGHIISTIVSLAITFATEKLFTIDNEQFFIEINTDVFIMLMLLILGISLIGNALLLPFINRPNNGWINILFIVIAVIAVYGLFAYAALGDISFFQQENLMQRLFQWIATHEKELWAICGGLAGIGIASMTVSYGVTIKTYLKYT